VDPAAGESSAIEDPDEGAVAVAKEGVAAEDLGWSPSGADDAEGLSPLGAGDPVGARVSVGEAKRGAEDPVEAAPVEGVGGDRGDVAGRGSIPPVGHVDREGTAADARGDVAGGDSVPPVGHGDRGGTAADAVVVGGRSEASRSEAISRSGAVAGESPPGSALVAVFLGVS
jgi:hypothetical protein